MTLRINLFPDPNMANTIFKCIPMRCTADFPTVSGFRWLRATTSGSGDIYAQYQLAGVDLPRAGVYHIHAVCYAQGSGALFRVYAGVDAGFTILYETGIADNQTKSISADITIPANTTQLLIRVVPPSTVGKFILIRDILLESKSTYDTAVGGASGLLHGRHDAARIGASVGRVMSDDADYKLACASESGRPTVDVEQSDRDRELGWNENLLLCFGRHAEPFRTYVRWKSYGRGVRRQIPRIRQYRRRLDQTARRHEGWHLGVQTGERLLEPVFPIGESPHSARLGDLHVRRLAEAPVAGRDAVRRGYHATRLTLTGVMA